jgi:hypothetical protein
MKKVGLLIIALMLSFLPCNAKTSPVEDVKQEDAPKIFVYHIPDEVEAIQESKGVLADEINGNIPVVKIDIISDDVTADTSGIVEETPIEDEIAYEIDESIYQINDMYSDVLYGYAAYDQDEDAVVLEDSLDEFQAIHIQRPYNYKGGKYLAGDKSPYKSVYSKFNHMEYAISPVKFGESESFGNITTGTAYEEKIDYAELRQVSSIYSKYDAKHYALTTEFSKTVNSTNGDFNDYFSFTPEIKLGQYLSLKETVSANFAKHIKIAEFYISINPFGKRDIDRFNIEMGTSSIFDQNNSLIKNRFKIMTKFKL